MGKLIVEDRDGKTHEVEANEGLSFMEILRDAGLDIEAACGGCCACATCHVYINDQWINKLPKIEEEEEGMLDQAFNVKKNSRLSCQLEFSEEINEIELILAPE